DCRDIGAGAYNNSSELRQDGGSGAVNAPGRSSLTSAGAWRFSRNSHLISQGNNKITAKIVLDCAKRPGSGVIFVKFRSFSEVN
ncbi:hypothetical protein, partial [Pseudomonas sp. SIMBA_044]|uniref:hypothetical protein n=1 Tax=Pseudomonas sp. SIMBA_044 TaxID=3085785 RepID=UPI0039786870